MKAITKSKKAIEIVNQIEAEEIIKCHDNNSIIAIVSHKSFNYGNLRKVMFCFPWEQEVIRIETNSGEIIFESE